ncbi:hypothetical protein HBI56_065950 [Parastagonospora nodorum]|nr:hypothetical protein HBH53_209860 [Parastagonospora nodorum]KAH4035832.1 hypothetical protein HBI09_092560 [Parastagonospora nodorum]KAH4052777.1 hypothetical protein HBH49_090420 [Parastagonospora nodorum]KAH4068872.1 hypothetical protein HBH50_120120 [Parastagonospora nodorum]KAH4100462.1 hypothetical protein HBH48_021660 [Parastagonospora nodorum]
MKIYLAPVAYVEGKVLDFKTPKAFREHYEKPENKDTLPVIFVDTPAIGPSIKPADGNLEKGFNYVAFYGPMNQLHASTKWSPSEFVPPVPEWDYMHVRFSDKKREWLHEEVVGDNCTGVYYVGDDAPTRDQVIYENEHLQSDGE